jgi:hypothetical protein
MHMMHVVSHVAWWGALVPLALLVLFKRDARLPYWLVASAFAVSAVADSIAALTSGSWIAVPWYQFVQWSFFLLAVTAGVDRKLLASIVCYAGVGTVFYLGMIQHRDDPAPYTAFVRWWVPYQTSRLASFGLFGWATWRTE